MQFACEMSEFSLGVSFAPNVSIRHIELEYQAIKYFHRTMQLAIASSQTPTLSVCSWVLLVECYDCIRWMFQVGRINKHLCAHIE
jgi:hypothetical protein